MHNTEVTDFRPSFEEAKARYIHRFTMEHVPAWARRAAPNGCYYAPQFVSDAQWYANTKFPGEIEVPCGFKRYCESSNPTWPIGKWLDTPYEIYKQAARLAA